MCEYLELDKGYCKIGDNQCPYVYFCTKRNMYRPLSSFPERCAKAERASIPKGYYKVCVSRRGKLYVDYNGHIEIVDNPFDEVPAYVKLYKTKAGWKVKK